MNHKTLAIIVFCLWALMSWGVGFIRPRKCSEHETPDERYKAAVRAPITTLIGLGMTVGIVWAVNETFFQP